MTLSLQDISDRHEIQDLLVGYCYAVDDRDYDALGKFFLPDAVIDYSEMVPFKGDLAETITFLRDNLDLIPMFQHGIFSTQYEIEGDRARTRTVCHNPMVVPSDDGGGMQTMFVGLWYIHEFRRTADGWRIASLYEKRCYRHNVPASVRAQLA